MAKKEDRYQKAARLTRDRIYRACGENAEDPQYKAALYALQMMREELRKQKMASNLRSVK